MTRPGIPERLTVLPVRVRPRAGEAVHTYVRRLAIANHLRPSYLHGFLIGPPFWQGLKPRPDRLAVLSGIPEEHLARALVHPAALLIQIKHSDWDKPEDRQAQLFLQIRRFTEGRGLHLRTIAAHFNVTRGTVRRALRTPEPPRADIIRRRQLAIEPIRPLIDPMADEGLLPKQIWDRLYDDYDIAVTNLAPIVRYVAARRLGHS